VASATSVASERERLEMVSCAEVRAVWFANRAIARGARASERSERARRGALHCANFS